MKGSSTTLQLGTDTNVVTAGLRRITAMNYCNSSAVSILSLVSLQTVSTFRCQRSVEYNDKKKRQPLYTQTDILHNHRLV